MRRGLAQAPGLQARHPLDRGARLKRHSALIVVLVAACCAAYATVLGGLAAQWRADENYSHGFLVIPCAAYMAWRRRGALAAAALQPSRAAFGVVLVGALLFVAGQFASDLFLPRLSLVVTAAGLVAFVWGRAHLRLLAFPLLFLLFMIPPPAILFNAVTLPLQFIASAVGETLIRAAGVPVLREGNVLQLPDRSLEVVEACSGIRSLVSLMMIAVVISEAQGASRWATLAALVAAVPITIVTNAVRVAGTGVASSWIGPEAAEGFFHTFTGLVMFGTALVASYGVIQLCGWSATAVRAARVRRARAAA